MTTRSHEVNHEVTYEVNHEVTYEVNHEVNHETSHVAHLTRSFRLADLRLGNSVVTNTPVTIRLVIHLKKVSISARDGNQSFHFST